MCCVISRTATPPAAKLRTRARTSARPAGSSMEVGSSSTQDGGIEHQHAGQRQPLLLPAREQVGLGRRLGAQVEGGEHVGHPRAHLVPRHPQVLQAEGDVVLDGRADDLVLGVLEEQPDPGADLPQACVVAVESPPTSTSPASGASRPLASRASVLLPEPLPPTTASTSPAATSRSTPSSARGASAR